MTPFVRMVLLTLCACLWWSLGCLCAQRGSLETGGSSRREARFSILFLLPAQAARNGASSSGATSDTSVADEPKCRTLLEEVIDCPVASGEPEGIQTAADEESANSETVSGESEISDATKCNDSEIDENNEAKPADVLTNRDDGKRQFFGQANDRLGTESSGATGSSQSSRNAGSSPPDTVSMVQSFVDDMISRPDGQKPGYIMINSRNPAIIQRLTAALTRRYGSAYVIRDADAIQNLTGDSRIQTTASSGMMPVFPYQSKWEGGSSTEPSEATVDPEVDYIRQQLSSIAHITVSTGRLANDTLAGPLTDSTRSTPINTTDDAPSAPIRVTEDHANQNGPDAQNPLAEETSSTSSAEGLQYTNQQFSSRDSSPASGGQISLKVDGQRVDDADDSEPQQNEGLEKDNSKTKVAVNQSGTSNTSFNSTLHNTQKESEYVTQSLTDYEYKRPLWTDENSLDVATRPTDVTESGINETTNSIVSNDDKLTAKTSDGKTISGEESNSDYEGTSKNSYNEKSLLENEASTTGYEDYYEEIDGELVLSPTKFMRKGNPILTSDYLSDEDNYQVDGSGLPRAQEDSSQPEWNRPVSAQGFQAGVRQPLVPQHTVTNHQTDWVSGDFTSHGLTASGPANVFHPFPVNSDLMPNTETGEAQDVDFSPNAHGNIHATKFTLNQVDDNIRTGIYPLYPNYNSPQVPRPISADWEHQMNGLFHQGAMLPVNSQAQDQLWNVDKDFSQLALLEELDRIPVVYEDADLVTGAQILRSLPSNVLDYLARMDEGDLATLGLRDQMKTAAARLHKSGDAALQGYGETGSSTQSLRHPSDENDMSSGASKELTSSQSGSKPDGPARSSFSSGNYRQSDVNIDDRQIQPIPTNFFPIRPLEPTNLGSGHHGTGEQDAAYRPQLTPEQEGIISRLPVGMQHVVSSIVLAVQAPLTTTTTTQRPQQYPYPYPYAMYPYFPPPSYPYPLPPRDLGSNSGLAVQGGQDAHSTHEGVHGAHGHSAHTPHGDHGAQVSHGGHGANGVHATRTDHGHGAHDIHGGHTANGHGAHASHEDHSAHGHGAHVSHEDHSAHGTGGNQNSHRTQAHHEHGHHGSHAGAQRDDLRTGAADEVPPSRPSTSNSLPVVPESPAFNPDAIGASRLGEFDASGLDDIRETGIRDNNNKRGSITHVAPSQPDRNQGLLHLRQDPAQMGHGRPSGGGFVNYRPPQRTNMHMGGPVVGEVRPLHTTSVPDEIGHLIDPGEESGGDDDDGTGVTGEPQTMDREQVSSLLQSLFSSPTLLLMGIVFAASAAYMAIAMEEQAAQQNFQQAQLAAAFGGQPFPSGRRRRSVGISWYPRLPQLADRLI